MPPEATGTRWSPRPSGARPTVSSSTWGQHPSTHGVLRLILTLDGETVTEARVGIGYLHTGIEKNMEYRTWTQGTTFVTRMDYLTPLFNETAYCLAVEKLLGITDQVPERANVIRVMMMELNRISSHFVAMATFGMELGATTVMTNGFREREMVLDIFEMVTGLRMNHAYIRPGGVAQDLPPGTVGKVRELLTEMPKRLKDMRKLLDANPIYLARTRDVAYLDVTGCLALGVTGPILRAAGLPWDLRKAKPYCGYENYEFDIPVSDGADVYARYRVRMAEIEQSLKIIEQCLDKLKPGPVMIEDPKIGWPAQLALGPDGMGNAPSHIAHIMGKGGSMEASSTTSSSSPKASGCPRARPTQRWKAPRANSAASRSATAVPAPTGCTSGTPRSPISKLWRPCAKAVPSPTSSPL